MGKLLCARSGGVTRCNELLADWPVDRPRRWLAVVNEEQEQDKELESGVKLSIERGRPYGSEKWVQRMAGTLNLRQSLRPRGRPVGWRKAKDKGERGKC